MILRYCSIPAGYGIMAIATQWNLQISNMEGEVQ